MSHLLLIGAGGIARRHLRAVTKIDGTQVTVVEPDDARRAEVCREYPVVRSGHADLGEADLGAFDAAVICAPAHVHVPLAQACADAGLHILLEKPLGVTMDGVDRLIDTVRAKGLVVRVGYVRRASDETIRFRQQIVDGRIGKPRLCVVNAAQQFAKYRPDYRQTYFAHVEAGGGTIQDSASHMIDLLLWTLGDVCEVASMYDRLGLDGIASEDSALISLRFRSGAMAQISNNQFQRPNTCTLEMAGTEGTLVLDAVANQLRFMDDDSAGWHVEEFARGVDMMAYHEARFLRQAQLFLGAIRGEACHLTTLDEARQNLRVVLAARASYDTKRIVEV